MDAMDRKLLNLLQADSSLTADELSERVALSPSTIARRLKRLRRDGVIAAETAVLSLEERDKRLTAVLHVQLDRHKPPEWQALKRELVAASEVQICLETSGAMDVLMIVSVRDMQEFNEFTDHLTGHSLVRRYETSFVKRHVKVSLAVELAN